MCLVIKGGNRGRIGSKRECLRGAAALQWTYLVHLTLFKLPLDARRQPTVPQRKQHPGCIHIESVGKVRHSVGGRIIGAVASVPDAQHHTGVRKC